MRRAGPILECLSVTGALQVSQVPAESMGVPSVRSGRRHAEHVGGPRPEPQEKSPRAQHEQQPAKTPPIPVLRLLNRELVNR